MRQHFVCTLAGWRRGRTDPDPPWAKQPPCNLPCNTNGMFVWHLRPFDLVYTFVSEHKRQHHSFRPSVETALARGSFIRTCPAIHLLFFCVCHSSPLERSSAPTDWRKFDETAAVKTQTTRHKGNHPNGDRDTKTHKHQRNKNGLSKILLHRSKCLGPMIPS